MTTTTYNSSDALDAMLALLGEAAEAAVAGGTPPATLGPMEQLSIEEVKRLMQGALLKLKSGAWATIGTQKGVQKGDGVANAYVYLRTGTGSATKRSMAWVQENVSAGGFYPGVLLDDGGVGDQSKLQVDKEGALQQWHAYAETSEDAPPNHRRSYKPGRTPALP